ncbi:DUF1178 family protein [Acetobacter sp. DsW_063]|uniref:DUF1178 family protein n=1 Tax=Acetobacter sp. DsW_063 TaxID=1514894 RepID=UPI000A3AC4E8|nr:DUF1178 family protein [Acetobacter sp. DsW_063]OUJ15757.1 hypothetical protein HK28_06990 [Acetobacter sp. DsW_063]
MIHYQLRCVAGHEFEGWFRNSTAFDDQAARGLLSCPQCGASDVARALMAPSVVTAPSRALQAAKPFSASGEVPASGHAAGPIPDALLAALQRLRREVETKAEHVGDSFADEALRMHRKEADERAIYGSMSDEQREALEDEGVPFQSIPWVARSDG